MAKILLIEDDAKQNEMVAAFLEMDKHTVEFAITGKEAMDMLSVSSYDVVIIDWGLPDISGMEVLRWYRSRSNGHVIVLTGQQAFDSRIQGLDAGADDYVIKPFSVKELSARIRAVLRRAPMTGMQLTACGYTLDSSCLSLMKDGHDAIRLTPMEFALIEFLARHPREIFKAEALIARVWPSGAEVSPEALRATIKRVREKAGAEIIETVAGAGYKLGVME